MCTRVVYSGSNGMVATGRSMDWKTDMHSNLWVFPRGMKRNGETGENSLEWTSRYGSVVTSAFEIASTDGMNEKGLVANLLWLPETEYPVRDKNKRAGQNLPDKEFRYLRTVIVTAAVHWGFSSKLRIIDLRHTN